MIFSNGPKDLLKNNLNALLPGSAPSRILFWPQGGPKPSSHKTEFLRPTACPISLIPRQMPKVMLNAALGAGEKRGRRERD